MDDMKFFSVIETDSNLRVLQGEREGDRSHCDGEEREDSLLLNLQITEEEACRAA